MKGPGQRRRQMRPGFTVVEVMVAIVISAMVMGGVAVFIVGAERMIRDAIAVSETSLAMRDFREKLLYRSVIPYDGRVWAGVASGTGVVLGNASVRCSTYGIDVATGASVAQTIDLQEQNQGGYFVNVADSQHESARQPWFKWWNVPLLSDVYKVDSRRFADRQLFCVWMRYAYDARHVYRQRVVVPVFGKEQQSAQQTGGRIFHD